ncbi:MAG: RNA pseudouridine synthase [Hyphomicrobiales bacterium]|nr:MAG: RNA pseudouridine synthase [Hyphomicrobiales bacterium]
MNAVQNLKVELDEADMRLDRWFKAHFPGLGFGQLQKLLRSGQIRVDGGRVKSSTRLLEGQMVRVPPLNSAIAGKKVDGQTKAAWKEDDYTFLRSLIMHEDDQVMVLNKPYGLAVQGGSGLTRHVDGMLEAFRDKKGQKPRLVHRLDRDTAGVLLIAKTRAAAKSMAESFRARDTRKTYWAVVKGVPRPLEARVSTHLVKEATADGDRMRIARHGEPDADHAVTHYRVVERAGDQLAWLELRPITGRTHQLRIHTQYMGTPIIGDPKYFDIENWDMPGGIQHRLHLHAHRIIIPHPAPHLGVPVLDITAPLPPHMKQTFNLLGFDEQSAADMDEEGDF